MADDGRFEYIRDDPPDQSRGRDEQQEYGDGEQTETVRRRSIRPRGIRNDPERLKRFNQKVQDRIEKLKRMQEDGEDEEEMPSGRRPKRYDASGKKRPPKSGYNPRESGEKQEGFRRRVPTAWGKRASNKHARSRQEQDDDENLRDNDGEPQITIPPEMKKRFGSIFDRFFNITVPFIGHIYEPSRVKVDSCRTAAEAYRELQSHSEAMKTIALELIAFFRELVMVGLPDADFSDFTALFKYVREFRFTHEDLDLIISKNRKWSEPAPEPYREDVPSSDSGGGGGGEFAAGEPVPADAGGDEAGALVVHRWGLPPPPITPYARVIRQPHLIPHGPGIPSSYWGRTSPYTLHRMRNTSPHLSPVDRFFPRRRPALPAPARDSDATDADTAGVYKPGSKQKLKSNIKSKSAGRNLAEGADGHQTRELGQSTPASDDRAIHSRASQRLASMGYSRGSRDPGSPRAEY